MEYIDQVKEILRGDTRLTCPSCGEHALEDTGYEWICETNSCRFSYSSIPSLDFINEIKALLYKLNIIEELRNEGLIQ